VPSFAPASAADGNSMAISARTAGVMPGQRQRRRSVPPRQIAPLLLELTVGTRATAAARLGASVMMVIVFRARRTAEGDGPAYKAALARMAEIATKMPGYISHKAYVAEDGERLTLFEWETEETLRAWAAHPEHVPTKTLGRERFYTQYHLQVCELVRESKFVRDDATERSAPADSSG
jgi:heme-degrading monooxygenase HmoA